MLQKVKMDHLIEELPYFILLMMASNVLSASPSPCLLASSACSHQSCSPMDPVSDVSPSMSPLCPSQMLSCQTLMASPACHSLCTVSVLDSGLSCLYSNRVIALTILTKIAFLTLIWDCIWGLTSSVQTHLCRSQAQVQSCWTPWCACQCHSSYFWSYVMPNVHLILLLFFFIRLNTTS